MLQLSQHLDGSKEEVAQLKVRCNEFWHQLEPTQYLSLTAVDACGRLPALPLGVEELVLMTPLLLKWWSRIWLSQRVTACLSISAVR